jgi:hypothetical protein
MKILEAVAQTVWKIHLIDEMLSKTSEARCEL